MREPSNENKRKENEAVYSLTIFSNKVFFTNKKIK